MQGPTNLFWRLFPDVRQQERPRFLFFAGLAALVSLAQTLGLTGSEALFLGGCRNRVSADHDHRRVAFHTGVRVRALRGSGG